MLKHISVRLSRDRPLSSDMAQAGTVLIAAWLLSLSGADSDYPIPTNINFQVCVGG